MKEKYLYNEIVLITELNFWRSSEGEKKKASLRQTFNICKGVTQEKKSLGPMLANRTKEGKTDKG